MGTDLISSDFTSLQKSAQVIRTCFLYGLVGSLHILLLVIELYRNQFG